MDEFRESGDDLLIVPANREMTMMRCQSVLLLFGAVMLFTILGSPSLTLAADNNAAKDDGKVAGILIEKKDDWITVTADGEDEPVKYLVAKDADKKLTEAMKSIYNASRVQWSALPSRQPSTSWQWAKRTGRF